MSNPSIRNPQSKRGISAATNGSAEVGIISDHQSTAPLSRSDPVRYLLRSKTASVLETLALPQVFDRAPA
ncbi:MAG: hypothetical protein ACK4NW_00900 [Roseinatronobacter sp.]